MMARKCSPIPRLADDYSREAAAKCTPEQLFRECLELLGCYGAGKVRKLAEIVAATAPCSELSLGSAIVTKEWGGARERLGRNRPALRGFNSEREASWTG